MEGYEGSMYGEEDTLTQEVSRGILSIVVYHQVRR